MSPVVSKPSGIAKRDVMFRARQLVGGHRLPDAVQLVEELLQRVGGLVGLDAGGRDERPGAQPHVELRLRAVRVAVLLAQVQVEPRRERAAEHRVHHRDREVVGRRSRRRRPSRCAPATAARPACRRCRSAARPAAPASVSVGVPRPRRPCSLAEAAFRAAARRDRRHVADDDERGVRGLVRGRDRTRGRRPR